jgi:hypothetical protein
MDEEQGFKMDPELKAKWLAALRSGSYQQGRGALLHCGDGDKEYCCLGVLGRLCGCGDGTLESGQVLDDINMAHVLGPWSPPGLGRRFFQFDPGRRDTHVTIQRRLAAMNDAGASFSQIADWIEANL